MRVRIHLPNQPEPVTIIGVGGARYDRGSLILTDRRGHDSLWYAPGTWSMAQDLDAEGVEDTQHRPQD